MSLFKEFLSLDLLDKNLSLENYLSKAGLVNYKVIYESNMPEDNRLLEAYRVIDIKEIPKELRLQYAIKLVEKYPLDACLFEVEDNSYISIICKMMDSIIFSLIMSFLERNIMRYMDVSKEFN